MANKSRFDGVVARREVTDDGCVYACDRNGRPCWDNERRERVVLVNDLRKYGAGLHIGQLGWTVPGTTDGYKQIDVEFDNGHRLMVLTFGLQRVVPEKAEQFSQRLIEENRSTRYDADWEVAERCHREELKADCDAYIDSDDTVVFGNAGHDEVYAFTFPSLQELARVKGNEHYPIKIGYCSGEFGGVFARIRQLVVEPAAYPERPKLLLVCTCHDGRKMENAVHRDLRSKGRRVTTAVGREWFYSNKDEVIDVCSSYCRGA
jgi:hypothetical protein